LNLKESKQLLVLSRKEPNARKRIRLLAVSLFFEGGNRTNIAKRPNTARGSVKNGFQTTLTIELDTTTLSI
jgi:hypothetical protein|tara:strand:- start:343 stop:555 length:213 start_codon:yes stop_codon:yes gene_type:complete